MVEGVGVLTAGSVIGVQAHRGECASLVLQFIWVCRIVYFLNLKQSLVVLRVCEELPLDVPLSLFDGLEYALFMKMQFLGMPLRFYYIGAGLLIDGIELGIEFPWARRQGLGISKVLWTQTWGIIH